MTKNYIQVRKRNYDSSSGLSSDVTTSGFHISESSDPKSNNKVLVVSGVLTHSSELWLDEENKRKMIEFCGGKTKLQKYASIVTSEKLKSNGNKKIKCSYGGKTKSYYKDQTGTIDHNFPDLDLDQHSHWQTVQQYMRAFDLDWILKGISTIETGQYIFLMQIGDGK